MTRNRPYRFVLDETAPERRRVGAQLPFDGDLHRQLARDEFVAGSTAELTGFLSGEHEGHRGTAGLVVSRLVEQWPP
jgi:hypothetical protein